MPRSITIPATLFILVILAGCSGDGAYWGSTPSHVRHQLQAADALMSDEDWPRPGPASTARREAATPRP